MHAALRHVEDDHEVDDESEYQTAIYRHGKTERRNGLVNGNDERIIKLLTRNKQFVVVLRDFIQDEKKSKLVMEWYSSDHHLKPKISWAERQKTLAALQAKNPLYASIEICLFMLREDEKLESEALGLSQDFKVLVDPKAQKNAQDSLKLVILAKKIASLQVRSTLLPPLSEKLRSHVSVLSRAQRQTWMNHNSAGLLNPLNYGRFIEKRGQP